MTDPRHDPTSFSLLTYAWVIGLAIFGGIANFVGKQRRGEVRAFNITELIGELFVSGFAGVITFYLCTWADFDPLLTAVLVGMCGHMGSRAIMLGERKMKKYIDNKIGE